MMIQASHCDKDATTSYARSPIEDLGCLRFFHDVLGAGHHDIIAPVCKLWKQSYEANQSLRVTGFDAIRKQISFLCDSTTTLCSSIFTSTSRVDMAKELQSKLPTALVWELASGAGKFAELSVLQYALSINLVDFYCPDQQQLLVKGSALAGDLIKLQWLHTAAWCELGTEVCECAARCGSIEMLERLATFLLAKGCGYSAHLCCNAAAKGGHLDLIKWMMINEPFSNDMHIDHNTMMLSAAAGGSVAVIQWLVTEHDMQLNTFVLQKAAEHNRLAAVQYLRRQGCPWGAKSCTAAAVYARYNTCTCIDELQTLHWLHENGCPWNITEVREQATSSDNVRLLSYVIQHGGVLDAAELTEMLNAAGAHEHITTADWRRQQGAEWPTVLDWKGWVLDWARSEGCTSLALATLS
eukprot:16475-Heterococcus_DN1.PRE.3